jgi:nickel/cobalt transporter (NicO) family protein
MTPSHRGFALLALLALGGGVSAHPVAKDNHDRAIVVRLQAGARPNNVRVRVEYRLEVDEATVAFEDMKPFADEVNLLDYRGKALAYYDEFARLYAPIYASHLLARANGKALDFTCVSKNARLKDEEGKELGHLRCDFIYEAAFAIEADRPNTFELQEKNYFDQAGQINLSLVNETGLSVISQAVPDDALRKRMAQQPEPGDEERLRTVRITFSPSQGGEVSTSAAPAAPTVAPLPHAEEYSLLRLFLHSDYGFWLLMLMAGAYGAAHALTPGHGKTLAAAYLVGARGTIWHALVLGLVTTLTHTGSVLLLALFLYFLPEQQQKTFQDWILHGLGLAMGLMVTGMGFWLLLQRLAGRADHVHIGGGHHHHGPAPRPLGWWGVIVLGIVGGMVPCGDAVLLLLYTTGNGQLWLVLPALLAFSVGLAGVLVIIGVLVVQVPRFARAGGGRLVRALPILSALFITAMGLWLCYEGTQGR